MKAKQIISGIAAVSTLIISLTIGGCQSAQSQQSGDLMENIKAAKHDSIKTDDKFKEAYSDFSVELFKKSFSDNQNTLISPLSVTLALAMTANGANGQTKIEMETLLGKDIPLEQLNSYLCGLTDELTSDDGFTLCTANSIWFRDDENRLKIENSFLQTNADYYKAAAFKRSFDSSTCDEINKWVSDNTDGMVDKILDEIPYEAIMYLINAVSFDAEWESEYYEHQVCYIPNKEVADEMNKAIKATSWVSVAKTIQDSKSLLEATTAGNEEAVARAIDRAHDENTSILSYNDENSLACVLTIAYIWARNEYIVHREYATGKGYADLVMIPRRHVAKPALIIELKFSHSADTAIAQIKRKNYPVKIAEYAGDMLLVGINYDKATKQHTCKIERLEKN